MNKTIFGKMITDYSGLEDFSLVSYTESGMNYDAIYENLLLARKAGMDFSTDIQMSKNGSTGQPYVRQTLIFIKTDEVKRLRDYLHGNMKVDYCSSAAYLLPPACIFRLAAGYGINKVYCERDELAVGKILMKAGNTNKYIFVSPEIHEMTRSDGSTKPILMVPAYGALYKRSSGPSKTQLSANGIVVRGGSGIYLSRLKAGRTNGQQSETYHLSKTDATDTGLTKTHAYIHAENMDRKGYMKSKDYVLKKIFDAMDEAGCSLRFEMWDFESDPRFNFDKQKGSEIQLAHEPARMGEILRQEKVRIDGPDCEKKLLLKGLNEALTKYFHVSIDEVYSDSGNLKLLIINDKVHDAEKVYEQTKGLLTQHVTIQQMQEIQKKPKKERENIRALVRTCLRCLCVRHDLFSSGLTLIKKLPGSFRTFMYGNIDGEIYSLEVVENFSLKVQRCRANACRGAREYLRSMQADVFIAMKDTAGHLYTIRDTGQPAIPPVRPEITDYNNRCQATKDKIGALFNFSWSTDHNDFFYISGYSVRDNKSPRNYPHVYEIHPICHTVVPEPEDIFSLVNVGFVRNDQESAVVPWGIKYLREYISCLNS